MQRTLLLSFATLALSAGASQIAFADTVSITLLNPAQSTLAGTTLAYNATISAPSTNTGNEFLNGDAYNLVSPLGLSDTPFLNNFPLFLVPGQSITAELFAVAVPLGSSLNTFAGTFSLIGGSTSSSYSALGTPAAFTTSVTPEPSCLLLLGTGLLGLVGVTRQKRATTQAERLHALGSS